MITTGSDCHIYYSPLLIVLPIIKHSGPYLPVPFHIYGHIHSYVERKSGWGDIVYMLTNEISEYIQIEMLERVISGVFVVDHDS